MKHTYICPSCHIKSVFNDNISRLRLKKVKIIRKKNDVLYPEVSLKEEIYNVFCPMCGTRMFQVDNDIADIIIDLNTAGLKTRFSCSGHTKKMDDLVTREMTTEYPYILFDESANELLGQIPNHFYYRCIEEYNLLEFKQSRIMERQLNPGEDPDTIEGLYSNCFRVGFKFEFKYITSKKYGTYVVPVHGKEYIPECLEQIRRFSRDLIEEVDKIKRNGEKK